MYTLPVAVRQCRTVSMNSIKVVLIVFGFRRGHDGNRIAASVSHEVGRGSYFIHIDSETSNLQATPERPNLL